MKKNLSKLKWILKWKFEEFKLVKEQTKINAHILPKGKKIILVPHSDDEWIGCSKIITTEKNNIILNMDMQGNDKKEVHIKRFNELKKTAEKYNIKLETVDDEKIKYINNIIIKEKPQYVCIPYFIDWHNEHIEVMKYLAEAIENTNEIKIIMYQVSVPILKEDITHYFPLTKKEWKNKWEYFKKNYKTQIDFPRERFAINEKINGKYFDVYAAEVFSIIKSKEWEKKYIKKILKENEKKELKESLHSIKKTRDLVKKIV